MGYQGYSTLQLKVPDEVKDAFDRVIDKSFARMQKVIRETSPAANLVWDARPSRPSRDCRTDRSRWVRETDGEDELTHCSLGVIRYNRHVAQHDPPFPPGQSHPQWLAGVFFAQKTNPPKFLTGLLRQWSPGCLSIPQHTPRRRSANPVNNLSLRTTKPAE